MPVPGPPIDPEPAAVWREVAAAIAEGGAAKAAADRRMTAQGLGVTTREGLLRGRRVHARELRVPGPAGELVLLVLTPRRQRSGGPGLFWIHGGGLVAGNRFGATEALNAVEGTGVVTISVEYRLAHEAPSPAAADDCAAALRWVVAHAAQVGIDPGRVILGGASAGGGLAASTALRLRDEGGPALAGLFMISPMLDDRMTSVSQDQVDDMTVWTRPTNELCWSTYLGDRAGGDDVGVYEAPGRATDLSDLPRTFVDVGSADIFRDESTAFASAIWAAGGDAELHVWPGGCHGFDLFAPNAAISVAAIEARRRWIGRVARRRA